MKKIFGVVISLTIGQAALAGHPCQRIAIQAALQEAAAPRRQPLIKFDGCSPQPRIFPPTLNGRGNGFSIAVGLNCLKGAGFENPSPGYQVYFPQSNTCGGASAILVYYPQQAY